MNSKTLLKALVGTGLAVLSFGGAVFGAPANADASALFSMGSAALDGDKAASDKDSSSLDSHDLKCPSSYYVYMIDVVGSYWGTYPSISNVRLWCRSTSGTETTVSFGDSAGSAVLGYDTCEHDGGFVTGLMVNHDNYIKDFKNRCGELNFGSSGTSVTSTGYNSDWYLDRVENNDSQTNLVCNDSTRVMTGMRLRFKEDSDEIAVTKVQLYCSVVTIS